MSPHPYLVAFRRYWYIVVVATLVGGLGGWGLSQIATPSYTATASLYFSLNFGGSANDLNQGATYTQSQMLSFAQLAESPLVLAPVIENLNLDLTPQQLADSVTVSTPQNTVVLDVAASHTDAREAALISNAIAASLSRNVELIAPKGATGASTVSVRVIQPAVVPTDQSSPNVRLNIIAGLLLGLIVGALIVVLREVLDTRVHSAGIATLLTGAPLLGSIERERKKTKGLVMVSDPLSNVAESYRQLRSNLAYVAIESETLGVVITSSIPGEGKSMIATNLALALSEGDQRVLLIDADLRRPTIASYTGLEGEVGLTTVLVGRARYEDVVQPWGSTGLHVLPSGAIPPNPSELLSSRVMSDLVTRLKARYDVVVIDTPPMTAVADAAILARLVDGALIVADRTRVHRPQLVQTTDSLAKSGVRVLGVVFNRVAPNKDHPLYYYQAEAKKEAPLPPRKSIFRRHVASQYSRTSSGAPDDHRPSEPTEA
ncbi:MAG: tyrosine-protein kinase [Microbacteriaceae bacterium]|jgi:capsular exopolysaccharide synthesis family protein|nr:tyrosine-protein kinase [Microbacteriaceae bacterium]